jgi:hypothetical protein
MTPFRSLRGLGAAGVLLAASIVAVAAGGTAYADTQTRTCDKFGSASTNGYVVMNNVWGADTAQCVTVTNGGFAVTADHHQPTNSAPASYAAVYAGCFANRCSQGTNLPMQVGQISSATSSVAFSYPSSGVYNGAYDIWLDPTPRKDGVNKQELMIWFKRQGSIQPVGGSPSGSATIGGRTWEVWSGNNSLNDVVSYVAPSAITTWNFNILDFINDIKTRTGVTNSWYLTSIQAGFEPWVGGTGLAVNSFAATVNGNGGGGSTPPTSPAPTPSASPAPSASPTPSASSAPPAAAAGHTYVVQPGDTLWTIAARQRVKGGWKSLYKRNRGVIGPDPNLILPGQRLSL